MMNRIDEFNSTMMAAHTMVWTLRNEIGAVWPTPDVQDSLRFAMTEAAEAMDAFLTAKQQYVRNNPDDKHADIPGEAADCAMMLLTALGEHYWFEDIVSSQVASVDWLCYHVAQANVRLNELPGAYPRFDEFREILNALSTIDALCNGSFLFHLQRRLSRIRNKHIGATLPTE